MWFLPLFLQESWPYGGWTGKSVEPSDIFNTLSNVMSSRVEFESSRLFVIGFIVLLMKYVQETKYYIVILWGGLQKGHLGNPWTGHGLVLV